MSSQRHGDGSGVGVVAHDFTALDDHRDGAQRSNVACRVGIQGDEIGVFARCDETEVLFGAEHASGVDGGGGAWGGEAACGDECWVGGEREFECGG